MAHAYVVPLLEISEESVNNFTWRFSADVESEITTLAAWCQVQQLQREPDRTVNTEEGNASYGDVLSNDDGGHDLTDIPASLAKDSDGSISELFLDVLAEILCYKKNPLFVASTAMTDEEDKVTIVAARNGTDWEQDDIDLMEYLAITMEKIASRNEFEEDPLPCLQTKLVEYYTPRIQFHVRELVKHEGGKTNMAFFTETCHNFLSTNIPAYNFVQRVVDVSDNTDFYANLRAAFSPAKSKQLSQDLGFIERPMRVAKIICQIAQENANFRTVKIRLLRSIPGRTVQHMLLQREDFQKSTDFETKYTAMLAKAKHVHAEIRVMTYLLGEGSLARTIPYLGVSKKPCFLCNHIIQKMGQFKTRAGHGKLYSQWTLPSPILIEERYVVGLHDAVGHLRDTLNTEARRQDLKPMDAEKESILASPLLPRGIQSTLFRNYIPDLRLLQRESEWLSLFTKRGATSAIDVDSDDSEPATNPGCTTTIHIDSTTSKTISRLCARCKAALGTMVTCPKCYQAMYCNGDCRKAHWSKHKFDCELGRPIDAADLLVRNCQMNQFPDDDTATAYGFLYFVSARDRRKLFDLYRHLVNVGEVGDEELREAWNKNSLKEFIIFRCSQMGDLDMRRSMEWLRQQQGFGAGAICPDFSGRIMDKVKDFLSPEDRNVPVAELSPSEKRQAYIFYSQILNGYVPDVDEDNWTSLGFCTAPNDRGVSRLGDAYEALVRVCRFDEFWMAMIDSTMIELFIKYHLGHKVTSLRNFKDLMGIVAEKHQSVWELKRFTRMADPVPISSIIEDYGFKNCFDARERGLLRDVYKEYFLEGKDEIKLHEACISGTLAKFLESILGELPIPHDMLLNSYPLEECDHMGMVADNVVICPKSLEEELRLRYQQNGRRCRIWTIPDESDETFRTHAEHRAAFLQTGLRKRITRHGDKNWVELSGL